MQSRKQFDTNFFILTRIFLGGDDEDKKADEGEGEGEDE